MMRDGGRFELHGEKETQAEVAWLVERHYQSVYSTCLRELGEATLAEDATQVVFLLLSKKASGLRNRAELAGWLFTTSCFVSRNLSRQERRRKRREQEAITEMMRAQVSQTPTWNAVEPLLHAALTALRSKDREALLLRFFEGLNLAETGEALGISSNAAQMRVSRALERLRQNLVKAGVSVPTTSLLSWLPLHAVQSRPPGHVLTTDHAAASLLTPRAGELFQGVTRAMLMTKVQMAAVAAAALLIAAAGVLTVHARPQAIHTGSPLAPRLMRVEQKPPAPAGELAAILKSLDNFPRQILSMKAHVVERQTRPDSSYDLIADLQRKLGRAPVSTAEMKQWTLPEATEEYDLGRAGSSYFIRVTDDPPGSHERNQAYYYDGRNTYHVYGHEFRQERDLPRYLPHARVGWNTFAALEAGNQVRGLDPQNPGDNPLTFGYYASINGMTDPIWIADELRADAGHVRIERAGRDPTFGPLTLVHATHSYEGGVSVESRFWLASRFDNMAVRIETTGSLFHKVYLTTQVAKEGPLWLPTAGTCVSYEKLRGRFVVSIRQDYTFTDTHVNTVLASAFTPDALQGVTLYDRVHKMLTVTDEKGKVIQKEPLRFYTAP